jgi:hypothetical protein
MSPVSVWVELVIGEESDIRPFKVVVKPRDDVDDLMEAIMVKAKYIFNEDIHSLEVYPPGTEFLMEPRTLYSLLPGLLLSDPDFPSDITDDTPLIVEAQRRQQEELQQQASTTEVSL